MTEGVTSRNYITRTGNHTNDAGDPGSIGHTMTGNGPNETSGRIDDPDERRYRIYQCEHCENVALTLRERASVTCHDEPMEPVTAVGMDVAPPDVDHLMHDVFDLPKSVLDVCLCVVGDGPVPPSDVAETLDYDESTVRRHLNALVDADLLQKSQLNREDGGFVNVYHSADLTEVKTETLLGFFAWAGEATVLLEEMNLTKQEYVGEDHDRGLDEVFWDRFEDR